MRTGHTSLRFVCVKDRCPKKGKEVNVIGLLNPRCLACHQLLAGPVPNVTKFMKDRKSRLKARASRRPRKAVR